MKSLLDIAIDIAISAHAGQVDKGGRPYIKHPVAVMHAVESADAKIVAVLHDVVEDSDVSLAALRAAGFPQHIVEAIDALSRRDGELYSEFIDRVKEVELARVVKLADLKHNSDTSRLSTISKRTMRRLKKYAKAIRRLEGSD
jgi:(p)ppGpp synthase/HD superfamily hydrolase